MEDVILAHIVEVKGRKGSTYKARIRLAGHPMRTKSFKTKTAAKEWALEEERNMRKGEVADVVKEARQHTVKVLFDKYRQTVLSTHTAKNAREVGYILSWWESQIGDYSLAQVTPELISGCLHRFSVASDKRYLKGKEEAPRKKSKQTIKHYRDTLSRTLKAAVQWKWLGMNPVDHVAPVTKLNNQRLRFLSEDECKALLEACRQSDNKLLYPIIVFALSTGARKGEILNLTLSDINLERNTATFHRTKNGERRSVPISQHLKAILEPHMARIEGFYEDVESKTHWLFPRSDGLAPIDIHKAWYNALERAAIDDFRFHDLRHTAASYLAMNGATLLEIAAVLGHKTLQMVKRYSHISEQHTAAIVEKMNEKMFTAAE